MKEEDSLNAQIDAKVNKLMIERMEDNINKLTLNVDTLVKTVGDLATSIKVQDEKTKFNNLHQQELNQSMVKRIDMLEKYVEEFRIQTAKDFLMHSWLSKNWIKVAIVMGSIIGIEGINHLNIF